MEAPLNEAPPVTLERLLARLDQIDAKLKADTTHVVPYERATKIAGIVQAITLSVAVLVGGFWSGYTFWRMRQGDRAAVELEKASRALQQRSLLEIKLTAGAPQPVQGPQRVVLVEIEIKNHGNRSEMISWGKGAVSAQPVTLDGNGDIQMGAALSSSCVSLSNSSEGTRVVLPGSTIRIPILLAVKAAGTYFVDFSASISPREHDAIADDLGPGKYVWGTSTYVSIQ